MFLTFPHHHTNVLNIPKHLYLFTANGHWSLLNHRLPGNCSGIKLLDHPRHWTGCDCFDRLSKPRSWTTNGWDVYTFLRIVPTPKHMRCPERITQTLWLPELLPEAPGATRSALWLLVWLWLPRPLGCTRPFSQSISLERLSYSINLLWDQQADVRMRMSPWFFM